MKPVVLLGAGGHAAVLLETLTLCGRRILGMLSPEAAAWGQSVLGVPILGDDAHLARFKPGDVDVVIAVASTRDTSLRRRLGGLAASLGFEPARVVHPSAVISASAQLGSGAQIMAGAFVQARCRVGDNCIVNTRAVVEHDCTLGEYSHIAPGVVLSGGVAVGPGAHVGTGSIVIQGVAIGARALVGAGSLVLRDIPQDATAFGHPAAIRSKTTRQDA